MEKKVKVLVLRTAGTNCDAETAFAFQDAGAEVDIVHINQLFSNQKKMRQYHIFVIPGGFSYGDDIAAGRILANELRLRLNHDLKKFVHEGKIIMGICNGFQVLVKAGLLPDLKQKSSSQSKGQQATLMMNDSGKFEARWTYLKVSGKCIWTQDMTTRVYLPVAHGEGKFICADQRILKTLIDSQQIIFRYSTAEGKDPLYPDNPNGSQEDIAGIADSTGRILGLMPHPERHYTRTQHPFWTRLDRKKRYGDGAKIFQNGIRYIKKYF